MAVVVCVVLPALIKLCDVCMCMCVYVCMCVRVCPSPQKHTHMYTLTCGFHSSPICWFWNSKPPALLYTHCTTGAGALLLAPAPLCARCSFRLLTMDGTACATQLGSLLKALVSLEEACCWLLLSPLLCLCPDRCCWCCAARSATAGVQMAGCCCTLSGRRGEQGSVEDLCEGRHTQGGEGVRLQRCGVCLAQTLSGTHTCLRTACLVPP